MRESGILMPVASVPGPFGIGTLGKGAYDFVDFLVRAGQHVWQILPLSPTGFGDSPYQSCSAFAGNPYFIDFEPLCRRGLLKKQEYAGISFGRAPCAVDYDAVRETHFAVLRRAFARFSKWYPDDYYHFCYEQGWWLEDYALFMTAKGLEGGRDYRQWPEALRMHEAGAIRELYAKHEAEVHFWKFCQYEFFTQWRALKAYANEKGVRILGDIPIYVSPDSADVWAGRELFWLDEAGLPREVAGCPPDYFSADGQLWGNPLYNWDRHESTHYDWWIKRVRFSLELYDTVRIDHFRGFDTYYAIPYGASNARGGRMEARAGHATVGRGVARCAGCGHCGGGFRRDVRKRARAAERDGLSRHEGAAVCVRRGPRQRSSAPQLHRELRSLPRHARQHHPAGLVAHRPRKGKAPRKGICWPFC